MNRAKLKQLVDGVEAIEKEITALSKSKRDLFKEHAAEFDPKAVRKVIARRKIDGKDRDSEDFLVASYEVALGMAGNLAKEVVSGGKTYDEAADEAGVSRRTMARHVARERGVPKATADDTPHDPETGEISENGATSDTAPGDDTRTPEPSRSAEVVANPSSGPSVQGCDGAAQAAAGPLDTHSDDLAIPQFLQRTRAA